MTARKTGRKGGSTLERIEQELPPTLREYTKRMHRDLNRLEREVEKAGTQYRRRAAKLLREASHRLGQLEAGGENAWRTLGKPVRDEAQQLLRRLGKAVAPPRRKKSARKKASRKKGASRKKSARRKKTARRAAS